jgi:hypothetical protein
MRLPFCAKERLASPLSTHHTPEVGYFSSTCLTIWSVVSGQLLVVSGQWSVVSGWWVRDDGMVCWGRRGRERGVAAGFGGPRSARRHEMRGVMGEEVVALAAVKHQPLALGDEKI